MPYVSTTWFPGRDWETQCKAHDSSEKDDVRENSSPSHGEIRDGAAPACDQRPTSFHLRASPRRSKRSIRNSVNARIFAGW
ncbi:hypothetical protein [Burkholderia lata]|uniref:hypothetical protein n=1 Tax=Burkholderia lata (strain ATCC 17760 / DSM 23089 / LMG 22485 / NCIMB 9086 / R18194 / 383) TaxID=482957 RepID=UPI00399A9438